MKQVYWNRPLNSYHLIPTYRKLTPQTRISIRIKPIKRLGKSCPRCTKGFESQNIPILSIGFLTEVCRNAHRYAKYFIGVFAINDECAYDYWSRYTYRYDPFFFLVHWSSPTLLYLQYKTSMSQQVYLSFRQNVVSMWILASLLLFYFYFLLATQCPTNVYGLKAENLFSFELVYSGTNWRN